MIDPVETAKQFASQLEEADRLAYESDLAFASGNFNEYWEQTVEEAQKRIEAEYESISSSGTDGEDSGGSSNESDPQPNSSPELSSE